MPLWLLNVIIPSSFSRRRFGIYATIVGSSLSMLFENARVSIIRKAIACALSNSILGTPVGAPGFGADEAIFFVVLGIGFGYRRQRKKQKIKRPFGAMR